MNSVERIADPVTATNFCHPATARLLFRNIFLSFASNSFLSLHISKRRAACHGSLCTQTKIFINIKAISLSADFRCPWTP